MTALVVVETAVLVVLCVLVAGLLRGYAAVLQRLHALDSGAAPIQAPPFRTAADIPEPQRIEGREEWAPAHDIDGVTLQGEIVSARVVGVDHDTVIAFLSSTCEGCTGFWHELADGWTAPGGARLLVVARGAEDESVSALAALCPPGVDLVLSSRAWADFAVPGSPYVVVADGRTGRIKGEGSGASFSRVASLIEQSVADGARAASIGKPAADREREADVDRVLLSSGIGPGHASLYVAADPTDGNR